MTVPQSNQRHMTMKPFLLGPILGAVCFVAGVQAQNNFVLNPNMGFGFVNFDGSLRPGERFYLTTGSFQRGMAYNPGSGNIILVDRAVNAASPNISGGIYIINGTDGQDVGALNTAGMS